MAKERKEVFYAVRGTLKEDGKFGGDVSETRSTERLIWNEGILSASHHSMYLFVS